MRLLLRFSLALVCFAPFGLRASDVAISALPAASSVTGADVVPIVQTGTTKKASFTIQQNFWDLRYQPLDGDLTALAALTGTNNLYYRSAANTWTSVTFDSPVTFSGGHIAVSSSGFAPTNAHYVTTQAESGLSNEFSLGSLVTGIVKITVASSIATPSNAAAADVVNLFSTCSGTQYLGADGACHSAGSGTVTHTGGALTANSVVLGAGTDDVKVVAGIVTDGTAKLSLGVNTTTLGQVKLFGNTSGDATIQPQAVAGTSTVVTLPNASSTLPIFGQQITFSGPTAARTITVPDASFTVVGTTATQTLSTKRILPRTNSTASSTSWTPDFDSYDEEIQTALAGAVTVNAPTYSSTNEGERRILRIKDNGTARAITWNGVYRAGTSIALPTTTTISKTLYCGFMYNNTDSKWDLMAYTDGY